MERRDFIGAGLVGVMILSPQSNEATLIEEGTAVLRMKIDGVEYAIGARFSDFPDPNRLAGAIRALASCGIGCLVEHSTLLNKADFMKGQKDRP